MEKLKGYTFALTSAVLLGLMAVLVKIVLDMNIATSTVIFFRFTISSLFLAVFLKVRGVSCRINREQFLLLAWVGSVGYGVMNLCYYGAFTLIPVGLTSMIHYVYPVIVVFMARVLYHQTFSKKVYGALVLAVAGAMILSFSDFGKINLLGVVLALLAGVCYGIYAVYMDHPNIKELHGLVVVFYLSVFAMASSFIFSLPRRALPWQGITWEACGVMVVISLLCTVLALFLFREAVVRIGSTHTTILSTMEPVSAAVLGVLVFGEPLGPGMLIGSTLIIIAVLLVTFQKQASPTNIDQNT